VTGDLRRAWSPQQISGRLCRERNGGETGMSVSHEAIYTWMYALPKGELAEMEIARGPAGPAGSRVAGPGRRAPGSSG